MNKTLHIYLDQLQGSLPRVVGLVERRGFLIDALRMEPAQDGRNLMLMVTPRDSLRCVLVLARQLERLHGILRVVVHRHSPPYFDAVSMPEAMVSRAGLAPRFQ